MRHLGDIEKEVGKTNFLAWRRDVEREYDNSTRAHTRMESRESYIAKGIQRHYEQYRKQLRTPEGVRQLRCVDE